MRLALYMFCGGSNIFHRQIPQWALFEGQKLKIKFLFCQIFIAKKF